MGWPSHMYSSDLSHYNCIHVVNHNGVHVLGELHVYSADTASPPYQANQTTCSFLQIYVFSCDPNLMFMSWHSEESNKTTDGRSVRHYDICILLKKISSFNLSAPFTVVRACRGCSQGVGTIIVTFEIIMNIMLMTDVLLYVGSLLVCAHACRCWHDLQPWNRIQGLGACSPSPSN